MNEFWSAPITANTVTISQPDSSGSCSGRVNGSGGGGAAGFGGGFGQRMLSAWGEPLIKSFVQEAVDQACAMKDDMQRPAPVSFFQPRAHDLNG